MKYKITASGTPNNKKLNNILSKINERLNKSLDNNGISVELDIPITSYIVTVAPEDFAAKKAEVTKSIKSIPLPKGIKNINITFEEMTE